MTKDFKVIMLHNNETSNLVEFSIEVVSAEQCTKEISNLIGADWLEHISLPKEFSEHNIGLVADEEGKYRYERTSLILRTKEEKIVDMIVGNAIFV